MERSIYLGYDSRETEAFAVARRSLSRHAPGVPIKAIHLASLREAGLYRRPTSLKENANDVMQLWDDISEAPMSTEFAISRFLTPHLAKRGWALFMDCDMLARESLDALWAQADPSKALMVVQHPNYVPAQKIKMDGQLQTLYRRKNWSSVMLFNCEHPGNKLLTVDIINELPGRDLHALCWLKDRDIGRLDACWNWLAGVSDPEIEPGIVHYTNGVPSMAGYENAPYASEWRAMLREWLGEEAAVRGRPTTWVNDQTDKQAGALV